MTKKILVVDDELDMLKLVAFRLKTSGYEIVTVADGTLALETIKKEKPDLVLLDIWLPGISGYDVCKAIRADQQTKDIPILFFSGTENLELTKQKIRELKAQGHIKKPFDTQEFLEAIRKVLE